MNRPTKLNLVGAIFVILGLLSSIAHANTEVKTKAQYAIVVHNDISHISIVAKSISLAYNSTNLSNKVFSNKMLKLHLLEKSSQKPLLGMQVANFTSLVPNKFEKKGSFFEFAAKFNDKLQQILAYFDFSDKNTVRGNENSNTNQTKGKINLSSQHHILQDKVELKYDCKTSST